LAEVHPIKQEIIS